MSNRPFAVFDIDGTLIRWQLYHAVVDRLAKQQLLGPQAHEMLKDARMQWKRRTHPDSFREYELKLIKIYESSLKNLKPHEFDEAVKDIAHEYKEQVYTYTRQLIKKLTADGYMILAISGSQHEVVEQVAKLYGFDDVEGTRYDRTGGKFTGEKFVASHDKKTVLQKLIDKHNLTTKDSVAVGDSGSDIAMLEMVDNPIAFNPDRILLEEAKKRSWNIVIERKNVVYELKAQDGQYVLA